MVDSVGYSVVVSSDVLLPVYLLIVGFLLSLILKESKALDSALITSSLACVTMILLVLHTLTSDPTVRITTELPILLGTSDLLRTFTLSLDELSAFLY
jgi:hypothetical protein